MKKNFSNYKIDFSKGVRKVLDKLLKKDLDKILHKIKELRSNLENLDIKKLKKSKYDLFRLRVGVFRIIYRIEDDILVIYILAIGYRDKIYKQLDRIF